MLQSFLPKIRGIYFEFTFCLSFEGCFGEVGGTLRNCVLNFSCVFGKDVLDGLIKEIFLISLLL